jgi:hypothetical protein
MPPGQTPRGYSLAYACGWYLHPMREPHLQRFGVFINTECFVGVSRVEHSVFLKKIAPHIDSRILRNYQDFEEIFQKFRPNL